MWMYLPSEMLENYLEEHPNDAKAIVQKVILAWNTQSCTCALKVCNGVGKPRLSEKENDKRLASRLIYKGYTIHAGT